MKKICHFGMSVFLLAAFTSANAQPNLVLNPGLDNYITCPGFGQFSNVYINDWNKPTYGSTDYYHVACPGIYPSAQVPHSGSAYAGIICYNYGTEYREYMTGQLSSPLSAGVPYLVEFYISLNDGYIQAIKEVGAHLSNTFPGPYANALHVPLVPQIENGSNILADTAGWMKVSGVFVAAGGEEYITIGNFHDDSSTTVVQVGSTGSFGTYYFVDDVRVSIAEQSGVAEYGNSSLRLFPNPVQNTIELHSPLLVNGSLAIVYSSLGEKVFETFTIAENRVSLDLHFLQPGLYNLVLTGKKGRSSGIFIKSDAP